MDTRSAVALAVAVLAVTAGCQAPTAPNAGTTDAPATTSGPATEARDDASFVQTDAEFAFDPAAVYHRVGDMLDVPRDQRPQVTITVRDPPEGSGSVTSDPDPFDELFGVAPEPSTDSGGDGSGVQTLAFASGTDVTVYDYENSSTERLRAILAHEFVHVYQLRAEIQAPLLELDANRNTQFLYLTAVEGTAKFVEEAYRAAELGEAVDQTTLPDGWRNASAYARWTLAPYHYGSRYVDARVDDAANVSGVYANPPRSAEHVIHGLSPDEEPVEPLSVRVGDDSAYRWMDEATKGELFVRVALSTELGWNRSAAAAEGWGVDRVVTLSGDYGPGYAWVFHWDDAAEADEFRSAFADYAANRSRPFDVQSVTDETLVVFAGPEEFVASASASGTDANVTVGVAA